MTDQGTTAVEVHRHDDGVLELRLVGASRRNALGRSTIERIDGLVELPPIGTKAIVITAEGPDFSAGYDLREAAHDSAEALVANGHNFSRLKASKVPVIAALHGNVIGGGLELALSVDVRIATPNTKFALPAGRLGLVYSEEGIRLLVNAVGESRARAMLLAGAVLGADEARAAGLVSEVVDPDGLWSRSLELATTIASWSPVASSGNRRVLNSIFGVTAEDTGALRLASFEPGGELASSIERFASAHAEAPVESPSARALSVKRLATATRAVGSRVASRAIPAWVAVESRAGARIRGTLRPRIPG